MHPLRNPRSWGLKGPQGQWGNHWTWCLLLLLVTAAYRAVPGATSPDGSAHVEEARTGRGAWAETPGAELQIMKPRVVAAYPLWKAVQFPPSTLPWPLLDQLTLAFLVPGRDG